MKTRQKRARRGAGMRETDRIKSGEREEVV